MKRRQFITLLGGAAAWPLLANAQQRAKLPTIGFMGTSTPATQAHLVAALVQRLRELGWVEGRTVAIEYRWAEGRSERYAEIAAEFVRLKVDAILTQGTQAATAAKQATSAIPIVATVVGNPVGSGLVASLAQPGGNVTGFSVVSPEMAAKRLEVLREAVPGVRRVAVLVDDSNPVNVEETRQVQAAAVRRRWLCGRDRNSAGRRDDIEAKAQTCGGYAILAVACGDPKTVPIIWGQQQSYLVKQLRDYRNGERDNPIMSPIAKSLAQEDIRKIAVYFAAKSWPAQRSTAASASPPNGIAQCQPCHQPNFEGGPPAPRLAGLSYEYLVAEMRNFAADERTNNGDMPKFMQALTDSERDTMARYLSGL